jgi:hypothetical protein
VEKRETKESTATIKNAPAIELDFGTLLDSQWHVNWNCALGRIQKVNEFPSPELKQFRTACGTQFPQSASKPDQS